MRIPADIQNPDIEIIDMKEEIEIEEKEQRVVKQIGLSYAPVSKTGYEGEKFYKFNFTFDGDVKSVGDFAGGAVTIVLPYAVVDIQNEKKTAVAVDGKEVDDVAYLSAQSAILAHVNEIKVKNSGYVSITDGKKYIMEY